MQLLLFFLLFTVYRHLNNELFININYISFINKYLYCNFVKKSLCFDFKLKLSFIKAFCFTAKKV